jgi:hypothetical protein
MNEYPVKLTLLQEQPQQFQRSYVLLRLLFVILFAGLFRMTNGVGVLIFFMLPLASAVLLSQHDTKRFLMIDSTTLLQIFHWYLAILAYLFLLTDQLPMKPEDVILFEVQPEGTPTTRSALGRMLWSLPSFFVLGLLGVVGCFLWCFAVLAILIQGSYPVAFYRFFRGLLLWQARLLPYHSSLVEKYPPFSFEPDITEHHAH